MDESGLGDDYESENKKLCNQIMAICAFGFIGLLVYLAYLILSL